MIQINKQIVKGGKSFVVKENLIPMWNEILKTKKKRTIWSKKNGK